MGKFITFRCQVFRDVVCQNVKNLLIFFKKGGVFDAHGSYGLGRVVHKNKPMLGHMLSALDVPQSKRFMAVCSSRKCLTSYTYILNINFNIRIVSAIL